MGEELLSDFSELVGTTLQKLTSEQWGEMIPHA